jgi:hypothetical protein
MARTLNGSRARSRCVEGSLNRRPSSRLASATVSVGWVAAWAVGLCCCLGGGVGSAARHYHITITATTTEQ